MDRIIRQEDLSALPEHAVRYVYRHSENCLRRGVFILASDGDLFMNHSTDPNIRDIGESAFATRDILPDEEVTCDYRVNKVLAFNPDAPIEFPTTAGRTATWE